jgi:hypothetical protein
MDAKSEKELTIDDENEKSPSHQEPSCHSESCMWQTESNGYVSVVLWFARSRFPVSAFEKQW